LEALERVKGFWSRQSRNYKVFLGRDALTQLFPLGDYWNIFIRRLVGDEKEIGLILGLIRSIGSSVNTLLSLPSGWLADRAKNVRRFYLVGKALSMPTALMRFLARTWPVCAIVGAYDSATTRVTEPAAEIISIHSLSNEDRVRGISLRQTITTIVTIPAPMITAFIITYFGGLGLADNIRPLFLIQFLIGVFLFVFMLTQLQDVTVTRTRPRSGVLRDLFSIFKVRGLKLLFFRDCMVTLKDSIRGSFTAIYMVDLKGADQFILGWRQSIAAAANLFSIPAGYLADRFGRKRVAVYTRVFGWVAYFLPIITPATNPEYFIVAGLFESLRNVLMIGWRAFDQEFVPLEVRGRWWGARMLVGGIIGIIAPIIGGILYDINPDYIWWTALFIDACVIFPAMVMIPDVKKR